MDWIKIEDKLPEQYDTVLTYGHPNNEGVGITICTHSDGIFRFWESEKENKHTITHWAELPNTPKLEIDDRDNNFYIAEDYHEQLVKEEYNLELKPNSVRKAILKVEPVKDEVRERYWKRYRKNLLAYIVLIILLGATMFMIVRLMN